MKKSSKGHACESIPEVLSVIPTMDVVVFPHMIVPLLVIDERIINGIQAAINSSKTILLVAAKQQPDDFNGAIGTNDLYNVGTIGSIMRLIKIPDGGIKILVQGTCKAHIDSITTDNDMLQAHIRPFGVFTDNEDEVHAHVKNIKELSEKMAASGLSISPDFHMILSKMHDPHKIADFVLSHINLNVDESQQLLESSNSTELMEGIYTLLSREIEVSEVQERVRNHARESMNKSQKEYYLREQLKAIKKELGEDDHEEAQQMRQKLEALELIPETKKEIERQLNRLEKMAPDSLEANVTRNYLDWIFALPWNKETADNLDITHAKEVLDIDHYGLKEIKDRILDFLSVRKLRQDCHTPILCFVGPPGTGKTSLGKSIAKSLGRKYSRIALGGVKDEAEIRGHRRTYVGAMPGRFIQAIRKAGTCNPVIIIDELDKIGSDFRGDPSAALLELLDPQQNNNFYDNYLGIPFDLSKVIFIATANNLDTISRPLRDRMEIIHLSGYTQEEKKEIATRHIIHQTLEAAGVGNGDVSYDDAIIADVIQHYTREAGVRELSRIFAKLASKAARSLVEKKEKTHFTCSNLEQYLGPRKFLPDTISKENLIGITNGLAWTSFGGEMLKIEAVLMPGKGKLILTGQLSDVMKESAQAALSYARSHAKEFGIDQKKFTHYDLHIHVPAGAVPKDGPSAGITILSSLLSIFTDQPIDASYAMTGELNLRGEVMPIGGVKEKLLAAKRNGVSHIILPSKNKTDLIGLEEITQGINVIFVEHANEVLNRVLVPPQRKKRKIAKVAKA